MTDITLGEETITTFKQAVERVAAIAHAKLPQALHGHLERAHALCVHRHVWFDDDGKHAQVLSSDGETWYLVNGNCTCMDAPKAQSGYCKHKLATMLYRRASELLTASSGPRQSAAAEKTALPEAPASVNVRLTIGGADVQWTLRDQDEHRLAARLEALLTRFPQKAKAPAHEASAAVPATGETPVCPHHAKSKESTKAKGTFFCPSKMADGTYCTWRHPAK